MQTAVIGDAESEMPISLPREAIELDRFRGTYADITFWCGHWLGGCGTQLTTKLYLDRACHFAHFPHNPPSSAPPCRRAAGVDGADHLYVKAALLDWLDSQDIPAQARIRRDPDGTVHPGTVLVEPGDRTPLQVVLHQSATGAEVDAEALLGVKVTHAPGRLTIPGYVHRIRCHSEGTDRRVMIGTQQHRGTDWFDLTDCTLDASGLTTPAVAEIRRQRSNTRLLGQPRLRSTPAVPAPPVPTTTVPDERRITAFADLNRALSEGSTPAELRRLRKKAERAVPGSPSVTEGALMQEVSVQIVLADAGGRTGRHLIPVTFQQRRAVLRVNTMLARLVGAYSYEQATRALVRQLTQEAEQVSNWLTPRQRHLIGKWQQQTGTARRAAPTPRPTPLPPAKPRTDAFGGICEALRDLLIHTARLGRTVTLSQVYEQIAGFENLGVNAQRKAMDQAGDTGVKGPLAPHLASLISGDDGEPLHPVMIVLRQRGRYVSKKSDEVRALWHTEVLSAHRHYRASR